METIFVLSYFIFLNCCAFIVSVIAPKHYYYRSKIQIYRIKHKILIEDKHWLNTKYYVPEKLNKIERKLNVIKYIHLTIFSIVNAIFILKFVEIFF